MVSYDWDNEFKGLSQTTVAFNAMRSCIEADEPRMLRDVLNTSRDAHIYALLLCFSHLPSIKCIEYLISHGTPLNESFDNNPYKCTPQEYLDMHFNGTSKIYIRARTQIYNAIEKCKTTTKNKDHTVILIR